MNYPFYLSRRTVYAASLFSLCLAGCTSMNQSRPLQTPYQTGPATFIPADITKTQNPMAAAPTTPSITPQSMPVETAYSFSNAPALKAAYAKYLKTGTADSVKGEGFITLAYNQYQRPIMRCSPLHVCQIELAKNETINGMALGDSKRWMTSKIYTGTKTDGSWIVLIKPTVLHIATNLTIATDQRTYNLGLVSDEGDAPIVNFWYPEMMAQQMATTQAAQRAQASRMAESVLTSHQGTYISLAQMNFNYVLQGAHPDWAPTQVFDDGDKTFIRLPPMVERSHLPVLYGYRNGAQQMINYRYKRPYLIVDGLFGKMALISGDGKNKTVVTIINQAKEGSNA